MVVNYCKTKLNMKLPLPKSKGSHMVINFLVSSSVMVWNSQLLIKWFYHLYSQSKCIDDTIEHPDARNDDTILNLRDI